MPKDSLKSRGPPAERPRLTDFRIPSIIRAAARKVPSRRPDMEVPLMSPALFVLAALASPPEGPDPAATEAPIAYRVSVLEMEGLGWRQAQGDRLTRIRRPGSDAVWSAGREIAPELAKAAGRTIHEPTVVGRPDATAGLTHAVKLLHTPSFKWLAADPDATGSNQAPTTAVEDKLDAEVTGRRLDQGVLARVAIENTWVATFHAIDPSGAASHDLVPEIARAHAAGEWLIPADGVLIVSLGVHTIGDGSGKAVVRERLAVIEANPAKSPAACPVEATSTHPADLPPLPEEIVDLEPAPHAAGRAFADLDVGVDEAATGNLMVGLGGDPKGLKLADQPAPLPVPTPPGRSLPRAFAPDGTPAPAPPKEDDEVKPTGGENSAEPRPTPQARPIQQKPALPSPSTPPPLVPKLKSPAGPEKTRPLTLPDALRVGLENAPVARVLYAGEPAGGRPTVIAPRGDVSPFRFKAEVMALVRSIDQQYWALGHQNARRQGKEVAVALGEEILRGEEARVQAGGGSATDVAAARESLERSRVELADATADVATAERLLRNLLNLPPGDDGRLLPVTPPTEARVTPDWDACLARMVACQPDILQDDVAVRLAAFRPAPAESLAANNGRGEPMPATGKAEEAGPDPPKLDAERRRASSQQVLHQSTHTLARFFLEVDASYKQFRAAGRLRETARMRLEARQASYEAGSVPIDRYLGALSDWSTAVASEAQARAGYNTSIIALEEAKGTLLGYANIVVAESGESPADQGPKVDPEARVAAPGLPARAEAPKSFTLRLPVSPTTTVQVRVSAGWVPGAARVLAAPAK